jgi:hypothetical protein
MAIQTRNSALAVKVETTEGTPVVPTASTDYVALQDDFSMEPSFDVLENAELKASLGPSKSILGLENPSASFSHYLRHSGVEGTAPNYKEILQAAFGNEDVESTEYDTTAGSTTTDVNVGVGEGAFFRKGQALLVKHPSNAYEIRVVNNIVTDSLDMSFALDNAPATSTNLGRAVTYYPAQTGHQTLSLWHYIGNSGAVQMMSGARVTSTSISFPAGELINTSFSFEGLSYYFDPINITSTDRYLDFTDDNGTFAAVITAKMYNNPHELAVALTNAMNTVQTAETHSVTYSDTTGKFTVSTSTSALLSLLWNTGANTANTVGDKLGFSTAADDTGATTYLADNAQSYASPQTPTFDNSDPLAAKSNRVMIGDQEDSLCFPASSVEFSMETPKTDILSICADSGKAGSVINARTVTITVSALLNQYDVDKYYRFKENQQTRFQYTFGTKSGGNWVPGKSGALYIPTATITSFTVSDNDGLVQLEMELQAYVDNSGNDEVFLSFV